MKGEKMIQKTTVYVLAAADARKKIREWYANKKNLRIYSAVPSLSDEGYEVTFSYDEAGHSK